MKLNAPTTRRTSPLATLKLIRPAKKRKSSLPRPWSPVSFKNFLSGRTKSQ